MSDKKNAPNENGNSVKPEYSNAFRFSFNETEFAIDYGITTPSDDNVKIVSKVIVPSDRMMDLVLGLFGIAQAYEKKFDRDLGFGGNNNTEAVAVSSDDDSEE